MSAFVLKIIACITMFIDHLGYAVFHGEASWFNYIGRLAFPIFAFQISEGYIHTKNLKKYFYRLVIFALISQIPFMLFHSIINGSDWGLNVIFTLVFGLLAITIYDKYNKFVGVASTIFLGVIANSLHCDYGIYGVLITFLFYVFSHNKWLLAVSFSIATLIKYGYNISLYLNYGPDVLQYVASFYLPYIVGTLCAIIPILLYNKKKGPDTKYLLYLFYPLHMLLIYGISFII
jgi:traX family protein